MRVFVAALAVCLSSVVAFNAHAQDVRSSGPGTTQQPSAQQLFERGVELTKAERWAEAQASFEASLALEARAATYLNLAIVRYRLGEYVAALTALEAFEGDAGLQEDVQKRAQWLREKLALQVVRFQLQIEPADALVEIDGQAQPGSGAERKLWLTPGQHEVRASAPSRQDQSMRIVATAGAATQASIRLELAVTAIPVTLADDGSALREPPSAPAPRPIDSEPAKRPLWKNPWLWTAVGVVVVGGAITAGVLLSGNDSKPAQCDPAKQFCL